MMPNMRFAGFFTGFTATKTWREFALIAMIFAGASAHAQLTIDVTTNSGRQLPIAIVSFKGEAAAPQNLTPVIISDLTRSGLFRIVNTEAISVPPSEPSEVNFTDWNSRNAEALLIGAIEAVGGDKYEIRYRLFDVAKQTQIASARYTVIASQFRITGHLIADQIYEKLIGERGVFSTRIAYVLKVGARYELQVADADGMNAQRVFTSPEPILSPKWSPDGSRLAYVSFESGKSTVIVQNLGTGRRHTVAAFKGDNSSPSWSPDGTRLVLALSRDSISQIYMISANGGEAVRLTESRSIDTIPIFTQDGQSVIFVSDRSGGPQLYSMPIIGGTPKRITFEGSYNVTPRVSPDGKLVTFVNRENARLRIATLELATGQINYLTDGPGDDSPSFAPNGRTILYENKSGGRGTLGSVSVDGRIKQRLTSQNGDIREPAWGPYGSSPSTTGSASIK